MPPVIDPLLWFSAIGCGLMAGLYFAFSSFIMPALRSIDQHTGVAAMNAINSTIVKSLFMPLFFATTLVSAGLVVTALLRWSAPGSKAMFAGGLLYVIGMFICTIARNVPLNHELAQAKSDNTTEIWHRYLAHWTFWNHVRTVASILACGCFIAALLATTAAGPE